MKGLTGPKDSNRVVDSSIDSRVVCLSFAVKMEIDMLSNYVCIGCLFLFACTTVWTGERKT